jgi:hypothetical protein
MWKRHTYCNVFLNRIMEETFKEKPICAPPHFLKLIYWAYQLFWTLGMSYKAFFLGDLVNALDNFIIARHHIKFQSNLEAIVKLSLKKRIINAMITFLGIVITISILLATSIVILYIFQSFK